jgi:hypothetical protein
MLLEYLLDCRCHGRRPGDAGRLRDCMRDVREMTGAAIEEFGGLYRLLGLGREAFPAIFADAYDR